MMGPDFENLDDATLVALALGGMRDAFSALLARHLPSVVRLCARLLGPTHEAQDSAQDAALAACIGLAGLAEPARFGAWLHAIAANLARMELRRRRPQSLDALPSADRGEVLWPAPMPQPDEIHAARELHDEIVAALRELSPANREVAVGYFLEGYSYAELAELLGVPLSTVKGRLFKSRRQLQRALASHGQARASRPTNLRKDATMTHDGDIPVTVAEIRISDWSNHRVLALRAEDGKVVPIWIGQFEAGAIAMQLEGHQPQRPMTHDLALRLLAPLGGEVTRVVVSAITNGTFFAEISVEAAGQTHVVDARPSDAIALAVRSGAPIFVSRQVYDTCGIENDERDALGFSIKSVEPPPSPFDPPTLWYLGQLARAANFELDAAHSFDWQAHPVEMDGTTYTSITLPGSARRRLLIEPHAWALLQERMAIMTEERRKLEELIASRASTAQAAEEAPPE